MRFTSFFDSCRLNTRVRKVLIGRSMSAYAVRLVRATRPHEPDAPNFVKKYLTWGAGPRACQAILLGAKAHALLDGRYTSGNRVAGAFGNKDAAELQSGRELLDDIEPRLLGGFFRGSPVVLGRLLAGPQSHELFSRVDHA